MERAGINARKPYRTGIDIARALAARYEGDFNFLRKDKLLTRALHEDTVESPLPASSRASVRRAMRGHFIAAIATSG